MHSFNILAVLLIVIMISSAANLLLTKRMKGHRRICVDDMCNATARYPKKKILRAAAKNNTFATMFGQVIEPQVKVMMRIGAADSANMCPTKRTTLTPRTGKTVKGEQKTIVNIKGYTQTVTVEHCDTNAKCLQDAILPVHDNFECQTQYVNIRMVVYNKDGSMDIEHFPVAAGCYCSYKEVHGRSLTSCNHI